MIKYEKNNLKQVLTELTAHVTFEKSDGSIREMYCTLIPSYLPPAKPLDESARHIPRKENDNVLAVWDIYNSGWRSFNLDSIINIEFDVGEIKMEFDNAASA